MTLNKWRSVDYFTEFKIIIIKMLNKLRKMIHEQNENINKEKIFKRTKQNLELKKKVNCLYFFVFAIIQNDRKYR